MSKRQRTEGHQDQTGGPACEVIEPHDSARPAMNTPTFPSWKKDPFTHQVGVYAFHQQRPYSIDTSEVGVGKTAPAIMALWQAMIAGKVMTPLIVCPNSIVENWETELLAWSDKLKQVTM